MSIIDDGYPQVHMTVEKLCQKTKGGEKLTGFPIARMSLPFMTLSCQEEQNVWMKKMITDSRIIPKFIYLDKPNLPKSQ
jgi:hypothetical protein